MQVAEEVYTFTLIFPGGLAEKAIYRVLEGKDELFISKEILDELLRVLATKFSKDREELARLVVWLSEIAQFVSPKRKITVLRDETDNRILEYAVEAGAEVIVTGDREILDLVQFEGIRILSLREHLKI
ncbi:putative toxin-antitoxin system toxin component, PIN family [Thermosulfurimonas sp. F29]|uniref:putative toxin-antitoxin system toxin component, PIN family n=1 Tax=Thermosulfurimonas sp. F29 TaxID=2867247 RepID=UPI001C838749|nr:putative toxin-antitoxin system toxin component, PIN family [Thermosulfurimonas sp. F29]MBX6422944.1 putative toxin-antitoxin system toxin component, PIN family [Thermosulfurimonas sp. F29]